MPTAATLAQARELWPDARNLSDSVLQQALDDAWTACEAYLPAEVKAAGGYNPTTVGTYRRACILHARDLSQAAYRESGDVVGFDQYAVRIRPLSDTVKALLRPPTGVPLVG